MRAIVRLLSLLVLVLGLTTTADAQRARPVTTLYTPPLGAYARLGGGQTVLHQATAQNAGTKAVKVSISLCDTQGACVAGTNAQCQGVLLQPGESCHARHESDGSGFRYAKFVLHGTGTPDVRGSLQTIVSNEDTFSTQVKFVVEAR